MTALLLASGMAILLLMATDVFGTVFNPEGHGGPITRLHGRLVWKVWKVVAPGKGAGRDYWLSLGGPALAVLTPAVWALMLVTGFALIYYPWMLSFLVSPGSLRAPWAEALYYSGFTAATLGTGDVVADLPTLRLLSAIEAISGFALVSASLSYILAIYRENGRKTSLASELALHHELRTSEDEPAGTGEHRLWVDGVARDILHITNAHAQYPILHYFRPKNRSSSLTLQIAPLVQRLVEEQPSSGTGAREAVLHIAAVDRYLEAAETRFVPESFRAGEHAGDTRYSRLLAYLGYGAGDTGLQPEE